jgi:outer membrane receptor protein involved in Fe transport
MNRRIAFAVLSFLVAITAEARYAGRPLAAALRDLEQQGLKLIYSEDVVTPQMVVHVEPRATEPRRILDELLAEQHLRVIAGPRGTLVIERTVDKKQTPPQIPKTLAEIVVTPSRFDILGEQPESRRFLSRDEVRRLPHLGEDLYRAIAHVPGTAGADITARFNIRGGTENETLVMIDGAEIDDPFHLKDFFRAFSTIDAEAVGSVDVLTGGFPAEYGGRMSGVIDIATLAPSERVTEAGISILNTRVMSQGVSKSGDGQWLLSFRRGYLREVLKLIDASDEIDPTYYDVLGKVQWTLGTKAIASAHVLASRDRIELDESLEHARAANDDTYLWLNVRGSPTPRLFAQSVLSYGKSTRSRHGTYSGADTIENGRVDDDRSSHVIALKNDVTFDITPRNLLKGGVTVRSAGASYDYNASATLVPSALRPGGAPLTNRLVVRDVSGTSMSAYVSDRMRLSARVVAEAGVRIESESWTPDGAHVSPRLNLAWAATPSTSVRLAWGRFYQPQAINELQAEDGVDTFFEAERSEHRVIGIEQRLPRGVSARLELYDKMLTNLRPRYDNIFDRVILFPELRFDRERIAPESGRARGAELLVRADNGGAVSGWLSYARASATDRIDEVDVARLWDQRDSASFSINCRAGEKWNVNFTGVYHSGWPTTPVTARLVGSTVVAERGALNSLRQERYRRADLRISRNVNARRGNMTFFVDLFNVLNQSNSSRVGGFRYTIQADRSVATTPISESIFGVVPSFGASWRF